jgi:succinyl-CoA synthetase alpha subunit
MSILVTPDTKVLIQGITGSFGARHAKLSLDYGTKVVAGVTPGKGGQLFEGQVPIFDTVEQAVRETGATVSAVFVPPPFAADAILEGVDAGLDLVVTITEGIPVIDMMRVKHAMKDSKTRLIGPNCPGLVTPGTGDKSHGGCTSVSPPATFTRRATSASSPDPAPLPTRRYGSSPRAVMARAPVSASAAIRSTALPTSMCSRCSTRTLRPRRSS